MNKKQDLISEVKEIFTDYLINSKLIHCFSFISVKCAKITSSTFQREKGKNTLPIIAS